MLETRIAALEGGVAALALASGQAASLFAVQNICHAGDNFVSSTDLYGGTWNLFANTHEDDGHRMPFRRSRRSRRISAAPPTPRRAATTARRCPTRSSTVFPIAEVAKIGRELGVPLIMDNTAAPVLCQPIEHGAAIVLHSTTKYIGGHGTSIGGIIVDGGNFDWEKHADRFPMLNTPDPSYHGAVWTQAVKPLGPDRLHHQGARHAAARHRRGDVAVQRLHVHPGAGDAAAAHARSIAATPARWRKHLAKHPKVTKVIYPGADDRRGQAPRRRLSQGRLRRRCSASSSRAARDAGRKFIDALKMFYHVANIGDARSLAIHPATTTHSQLTPEEQAQTGVTPGYVRLSIGIEHIDDILADLDQALAAV